ncbi:MAG: signal recognition particle protein [Proteobacteria bacterium]|nr:signal recognition particle protein [Pseudomonadota bacterium]
MFDGLSERLGGIFDSLRKRGALTESQVAEAMDQVRLALLDADVALPVVKEFVAAVSERAVGAEVLASVTPGQMVVKIVHDRLVETLGTDGGGINLVGAPPVAILMVGLQGSGKTTTCAKLASRLVKRDGKKVLMASLDVYRPAAQQQLARLGEQAEIPVLAAVLGERPLAIAHRAMDSARREGYDVVILDTAGRLHVDSEMMAEAADIARATEPTEILLVADAMTGQDAVNVAGEFLDQVGITGIVLTRVDGDARGGAALSMKAVTGCPVKLMGVGEKLDALEVFQPERVAGSILGMGDVVGLVEKASQVVDKADAEKLAAKMLKGRFTLDDMAGQFKQIKKMGDIRGLIGMLPGAAKIKGQLADIDERMIARQEAVILSMTPGERLNPKVLNGSRRRRIAAGSGTSVQDVNRLLKQFKQMSTMMKKAGKRGRKGMMPPMPPGMMPPMG